MMSLIMILQSAAALPAWASGAEEQKYDDLIDVLAASDADEAESYKENGKESAPGNESGISAPAAPVVSAAAKYNKKALVKWTAVEGADGYEIWRNEELLKRLKARKNPSYQDIGLKSKQDYTYKVRSYIKVKDEQTGKKTKVFGEFSEPVTITAKYRKPKVLIVDNSVVMSWSVSNRLKKEGCEVTRVFAYKKIKVSDYDALVIPGGGDVNPSFYGEAIDSHDYDINTNKDKKQIYAVKQFAKAGKPILGICRGEQLINVVFGGKLIQHIGIHANNRKVTFKKDSWLYPVFGKSASVYHIHHQVVGQLGEGIIATEWDAEDGHVEGIEHESLPIYGVQWHPEDVRTKNGKKVFKAFKKVITDQLAAF